MAELLCKLLDLMSANLSRDESSTLLTSQAAGVFFNEMPMRE